MSEGEFLVACKTGNLESVKKIFPTLRRTVDETPWEPPLPAEEGLQFAAEKNHLEIVKFLVSENVSFIYHDGLTEATALHYAAQMGSFETAKFLIESNIEILDKQDASGRTPLHYASSDAHKNVLLLLLKCGADLNISDQYGWTALHRCARKGHLELVKILLDFGADINVVDVRGWVALHQSWWQGSINVVRELVMRGTNLRKMRNINTLIDTHLKSRDYILECRKKSTFIKRTLPFCRLLGNLRTKSTSKFLILKLILLELNYGCVQVQQFEKLTNLMFDRSNFSPFVTIPNFVANIFSET